MFFIAVGTLWYLYVSLIITTPQWHSDMGDQLGSYLLPTGKNIDEKRKEMRDLKKYINWSKNKKKSYKYRNNIAISLCVLNIALCYLFYNDV